MPCLHLLLVLLSCRSRAKANNTIIDGLGEADAASFKKAVQLCQLYSLNKTTPDIWQFIIGTVQKGMPVAEAAKTYTLLTIGDGLVSQMPALLIFTSPFIICVEYFIMYSGARIEGLPSLLNPLIVL